MNYLEYGQAQHFLPQRHLTWQLSVNCELCLSSAPSLLRNQTVTLLSSKSEKMLFKDKCECKEVQVANSGNRFPISCSTAQQLSNMHGLVQEDFFWPPFRPQWWIRWPTERAFSRLKFVLNLLCLFWRWSWPLVGVCDGQKKLWSKVRSSVLTLFSGICSLSSLLPYK